jgi:HK97 gp10 family phage protein
MISVTTKVYNTSDLTNDVFILLEKAAKEAETEMKTSITSGPKSGVTYTRNNKFHTASAPGQAPANDSGELAGSIGYKKINDNLHEVKITADYALALEVGTSRMAARPFILPAVQNAKNKLMRALKALRKR